MSEQCPAKNLFDSTVHVRDYIAEAYIPDSCMRCINTALEDSTSQIQITDTYEEGLAFARDYVGSDTLPADVFDRWQDISLKHPKQGVIRNAVIESGFDLGLHYGRSYEPGSETEVQTIQFTCAVETPSQV